MIKTNYFEKSDKYSHKFYEISFEDNILIINYGRIGYKGKKIAKVFESFSETLAYGKSLISKKLKKGYQSSLRGKTLPRFRSLHPNQLLLPFE